MTDQEILGTIGEIYYQALFGGALSEYKYDDKKDLIQVDDKSVEIKVQSRYRHSKAFTANKANKTNLKKCLTVDRLIFIEYSLSDTILLWECTNRRSVFSATMDDGRVMACWPIEEMTLLKSVKHPKLAEIMRNFSKSETLGWFE